MYGDCRQKDFFLGALAGATLATLSALLFLTKRGKQIQQQVVDAYEEIEDSIKEVWTESKDKLQDVAEQTEKKLTKKDENRQKDSK